MRPRQKKRLGQVFLRDKAMISRILVEAGIGPDDNVVEIGCGDGALSEHLARQSKSFSIIEIDKGFLDIVRERLNEHSHVSYIEGDFLRSAFSEVRPKQFHLISNLPYQISSGFLDEAIKAKSRLLSITVMVQKEFADRLLAAPNTKDYGPLSIFGQFYFEIRRCFKVPRQCFSPIPGVDSTVLSLTVRKEPLFDVNEDLFFKVVRSAFWARRKTLANALHRSPYLKDESLPLSELSEIDNLGKKRGETLSISDFASLVQDIEKELGLCA